MIVPCSVLWPKDPRAAILHWQELAVRAGAVTSPLARPCLLAIRGAAPGDAMTHDLEHKPSPPYRDTGVVYMPGREPVVFAMTTTAYQFTSSASPKFDGDPRGAVGSIRPGRYVLHDLRAGEEVTFQVRMPDGSVRLPAWRDFDHNGKLSPEEMQRSEDLRTGQQVGADGTWADSILLHGGMDEPNAGGAPPKHKFSIGCLTAPRVYRKLIQDVARPHGGECALFLFDATTLIPFAEQLEQPAAFAALTPEDVAVSEEPPKGSA